MKRYVKAAEYPKSLPPDLKQLNWDPGESDEVIATADEDRFYYGFLCHYIDPEPSNEHYDDPYMLVLECTNEDEVKETVADEHHCEVHELPDQVGAEYDYYCDCEDFFIYDSTERNVVDFYGYFPTREAAEEAGRKAVWG